MDDHVVLARDEQAITTLNQPLTWHCRELTLEVSYHPQLQCIGAGLPALESLTLRHEGHCNRVALEHGELIFSANERHAGTSGCQV